MTLIIVIILLGLLIFSIWNFFNLNRLSKQQRIDVETAERYFELKYRIQFLTSFAALIIALIGFVGYNTFDNIKSDIKSELMLEIDSLGLEIEDKSEKLFQAEKKLGKLDSTYQYISNNQLQSLMTGIKAYQKQVGKTTDQLDEIQKEVLKRDIYVVENIPISLKQNVDELSGKHPSETRYENYSKIHFKDLRTNENLPLPDFRKPPLVIPVVSSSYIVSVFNVTNKTFQGSMNTHFTNEKWSKIDTVKFSVVIIQ